MSSFHIHAIKAFDDNYIWAISADQHAIIIDPGSADEVISYLNAHQLTPVAILITHHHHDHIGGVDKLMSLYKDCTLYAHSQHGLTDAVIVDEGSQLHIMGLDFTVQMSAGHTDSHLSYLVQMDGVMRVFCGDTLFSGGCGRVFEGTMAQMHSALARFAALPDNTRVCCAHEYTVSNLKFAREAEPDNPDLVAYQRHCEALRAQGLPTLPSTIGLEKKVNPFLRGDLATFTTLRQWKNQYR